MKKNSFRIFYKKSIFFYKGLFLYPIALIYPFLKKEIKNYDIIHVHGYHFITSIQCAILRRFRDFKLILHIHGGIQTNYNSSSSSLEKFLLVLKERFFDKIIGKFIINTADLIISVSDQDLKLIKHNFRKNKSSCFYVPNAVDIEKFKRIETEKRLYITLIATRLTYVKGVDIFLNIAEKLYQNNKSYKFLIVGDGPLKPEIIKMKSKIPIEYYPTYNQNNIQVIYNMSKVLLVTSRSEGLPSVILESLACETPVVASDVGGIHSVIKPGFNGYLYYIHQYEEAIGLVEKIITKKETIKNLGRNGRKLVEENYSWKVITNKIFKLYKSVLNISCTNS